MSLAEKSRTLARAKTKNNGDTYWAIEDSSESGEAMLTVAQVAGSSNVHPNSVRRWADSGLLQCYRIGVRGDRRFNLNDIQVFLESSGRKRD